jgi:acetyl esterase/lipase
MDASLAGGVLLALALLGAVPAFVALVPGRRLGWGNLAWFGAGFLVAELAVPVALGGLALLVAGVAAGALGSGPGRIAAVLILASCAALLVVQFRSRGTGERLEAALREALGADYRERIPVPRRAGLDDAPTLAELRRPFRRDDPRVEVLRDVPYGTGHARQRLDLYRPREPVRGAPVLLQIHGGGWTLGDKGDQGLPLMLTLAARGWICVAINYRLCPRDRFPASLVDCKRAVAWLRTHVAEYGGDPHCIVVTGGSAGGHLAALVALTPDAPELQPGFEAADTRVAGCVPLYGVYDFLDREGLRGDGGGMTRWLAQRVMPCPPGDDARVWDWASPVAQVNADAPPFFVLHGAYDSIACVEEARAFVRRLRAVSRAPVAYAELPYAQHAWDLVHSVRALYTARAIARFAEWVRASRVPVRMADEEAVRERAAR